MILPLPHNYALLTQVYRLTELRYSFMTLGPNQHLCKASPVGLLGLVVSAGAQFQEEIDTYPTVPGVWHCRLPNYHNQWFKLSTIQTLDLSQDSTHAKNGVLDLSAGY